MSEHVFGRKPNQAPINNDLGEMAYQSKSIEVDNIRIGGVEMMELMIRSWNPTYWFDYTDYRQTNGSVLYSKGNQGAALVGTNYQDITINTRRFWTSNGNTNSYFYSGLGWGYNTSFFFVSAYTPYTLNSSGSGAYYADGNSGARASVSTDSFGNNMGNGEVSFHAGQTPGYDEGSSQNFGGRLGSNNQNNDPVIHAVAGHIANWNDPRGGENVRLCTLNTGTLRENLVNNNVASGSNTTGELYWGNRHSQDRGRRNERCYAECIMWNNYRLNEDQYAFLEHYMKVKYGGIQGRAY